MKSLSVVIPAYNEKSNISITLTKICNFLNNFDPDFEILVVDDGSLDNTTSLVEALSRENNKIRLIKNEHKGKGFAVRIGVLEASGSFILLCDADLSVPIEELKRLIVWIKDNGFDVAIASREGLGAMRKNEPFSRHVMGKVFNSIIQLLLLPGIKDTQCGFKLFKAEVAKTVFEESLLYGDSTKSSRVPKVTAFDVEILYLAKKHGFSIKEVPVTWEYGPNTKVSKLRDSIINLLDVFKVKINDLLHRYTLQEVSHKD